MTKKHFIALAEYICYVRKNRTDYPEPFTNEQVGYLADFCASQNPQFNRDRWLGYIAGKCGSNGGAVKA